MEQRAGLDENIVTAMAEEAAQAEHQVRANAAAVTLGRAFGIARRGQHVDVNVIAIRRNETLDFERELAAAMEHAGPRNIRDDSISGGAFGKHELSADVKVFDCAHGNRITDDRIARSDVAQKHYADEFSRRNGNGLGGPGKRRR